VSPHVAESDARLILPLNVFQSVAERAPVFAAEARARERVFVPRERPFGVAQIESAPCLLLNVFQSIGERSPVAVEFAVAMLIVTFGPTVEFVPFVTMIPAVLDETDQNVRVFCLPLNVFQSEEERAPVVVELAREIPNTHVVLLYVRGPFAKSEVSVIFVPWSFPKAVRMESDDVTVPELTANPVRREVRESFHEKLV
jgi:hypothetical protein